ncbi:hypothetical protein [Longimicrobium sp.]|uniref:hypothetical protein n=1 Tax=Longimicrobium sp. TaxID=2029185 RepID=UPI002E3415F2|nr:hypothetical protein [Longimicrobium sp.]HEX6039128.1 hypothetical protein [Longimicrobium sp.]
MGQQQLSEDLQRDLHHAVRQVEEDGRAVMRRIEGSVKPGRRTRERIRVALAKLDLFKFAVESLIYDDPESVDAEIEHLNRESDHLILARAELDRETSRKRRQVENLALDRRELETRQVLDELESIRGRVDRA